MIKVKFDMKAIRKKVYEQIEKEETLARKQALDAVRAQTPVDTGEARDGWRLEGQSLVNDVEHIASLNAGNSRQAPSRFIEKTLLAEGFEPNGVIVTYRDIAK